MQQAEFADAQHLLKPLFSIKIVYNYELWTLHSLYVPVAMIT